MKVKDIEVLFKKLPPLDAPDCKFPGFMQKQILYKKGEVWEEGRRPFPCDIICDSDTEFKLDGGKLTIYADIYRPATDEKVPALICWGYGGKRDTNNKLDFIKVPTKDGSIAPMVAKERLSGLQGWECLDPAEWVQHGYAVINADPPGVNYSEGDMLMFGDKDSQRGCEFIELVSQMPWCTGKVGMGGSSWYAMVQFFFAGKKPPHLAAIAPLEAEHDLYRDEYVRGGMPLVPPSSSIGFRTHGRNNIEDIGAMGLKYPLKNAYWEDKVMHPENIEIPAYVVGSYTSWFHTRGTPENYNKLASKEKWYRTHGTIEWADLYGDYYVNDLRKFYDHYLKGVDNGWENTPPVRLALFNPGGEDVANRPEDAYPPTRMKPTAYYLGKDSSMGKEQLESETYGDYDTDKNEHLLFRTTFDRHTEIIGGSKLKLWVEALDGDDADVFARFYKVDSQGNRMYCMPNPNGYLGPDGKLRASHRELDEEKSTPLDPVHLHKRMQKLNAGEIVPVEIPIWPTGLVFEEGETLELEVRGREFIEDRPPNMVITECVNKGSHRIHFGGKYDSYLLLPICE